MLYKWKKELFEGALETFSRKHKKGSNNKDFKTKALKEKLKKKDSLVIFGGDHKVKKNSIGEI